MKDHEVLITRLNADYENLRFNQFDFDET